MKKFNPVRPATLALAALLAGALGACGKSDQEEARRQIDEASTQAAQAGHELKADAEQAGRDLAAAGREVREDAIETGQALKADAQRAGEAIKEGARDAATLASDVAITASVNAKLATDPDLSALRINVDTQDGTVTLSGPAPTETAKERAATLAQQVNGVKSVVNRLSVG